MKILIISRDIITKKEVKNTEDDKEFLGNETTFKINNNGGSSVNIIPLFSNNFLP